MTMPYRRSWAEFRTHILAVALRAMEEAGLMNGAQTHMIPQLGRNGRPQKVSAEASSKVPFGAEISQV